MSTTACRNVLVALLCCVASLRLAAQPTEPPACPPAPHALSAQEEADAREHARDRGFLWRVTRQGHSSYLYGTIHIAKPEWMFPGPKVSAALEASKVVALEIDITDPAMMSRLQSGLSPQPGEPGADLPGDLAERLRAQLRAACVPADLLTAMAPEMLGALLVMLSVRRDGLDASYGLDPALAHLAHQRNKQVVSLETPELQLKLMRSSSPAALREALEKVLDDLERDRARGQLLRVAEVWAESRAQELAHYREWCDCANTAGERAALKNMLDDRNGPMAARIDVLHRQGGPVFVAVGALHTLGPKGLPALLAKRGYRVERIDFSNASPSP